MCVPVVIEAVREEVSRRGFLRLAGAAAAAGVGAQLLGTTEVLDGRAGTLRRGGPYGGSAPGVSADGAGCGHPHP
jgi:hypothetical protein